MKEYKEFVDYYIGRKYWNDQQNTIYVYFMYLYLILIII